MFDNPKKELEWLEQQLLAAETGDAQEDDFDSSYDDRYDGLPEVKGRATGFDADDYIMDTGRYVPAPKKKGIKGLLFIAFLELIAAGLLISWWMGWLA